MFFGLHTYAYISYWSILPIPILSLACTFLQEAAGETAPTAVTIVNNHQSPQRRHRLCSQTLTLSATVVINCHREVLQRFPVVFNTMRCQICLANIYIYTNTLHREIKFQKELMLCVSEVGGRMQIETVNPVWAVCWQELACRLLEDEFWCRLAVEGLNWLSGWVLHWRFKEAETVFRQFNDALQFFNYSNLQQ